MVPIIPEVAQFLGMFFTVGCILPFFAIVFASVMVRVRWFDWLSRIRGNK